MADQKITELTKVTTLPDEAVFTAVDSTRAAGDQNVKIETSDLRTLVGGGSSGTIEQAIMFKASDVSSDLAVGVVPDELTIPFDITLTDVRASVGTAPTGANLEVDILKNGVSILSTNITIDAGEKNSEDATTPPVISDTSISKDDIITVEIIAVGSTVAGSNLQISLIYEVDATVSGSSSEVSQRYEYDLATEKFTVYEPIGGDRYIGFTIIRDLDLGAKYVDTWGLDEAFMYTFNGTSMVSTGVQLMSTGESIFTYQVSGAPDFTGGIQHGDEIASAVQFFASGKLLSTLSDIPLTACDDFYFVITADLYAAGGGGATLEGQKNYVVRFKEGGYQTRVLHRLQISLTFSQYYFGIATFNSDLISEGHNETGTTASFVGDNVNKLSSVRNKRFWGRKEANKVSVECVAESDVDFGTNFQALAGTDSFISDAASGIIKYYRSYNPGSAIGAGTRYYFGQKVKFKYHEN